MLDPNSPIEDRVGGYLDDHRFGTGVLDCDHESLIESE